MHLRNKSQNIDQMHHFFLLWSLVGPQKSSISMLSLVNDNAYFMYVQEILRISSLQNEVYRVPIQGRTEPNTESSWYYYLVQYF